MNDHDIGGLPHVRLRSLLLLAVLLSPVAARAAPQQEKADYPLLVSAGSQSLTVPWHVGPVANRLNPALVAGTERPLKRWGRVRLYNAANVGYFQNYWWMTGAFLDAELGAGLVLPKGFHADVRLGLGYLHYFSRRKELALEDGRYVPVKDWGRPSAIFPLSLFLGYRGGPGRPLAVAPFLSAQWVVQAAFTEEIPVMTHLLVLVGVRIDWRRWTTSGSR